jgi:hypothetical protein
MYRRVYGNVRTFGPRELIVSGKNTAEGGSGYKKSRLSTSSGGKRPKQEKAAVTRKERNCQYRRAKEDEAGREGG